MNRMMPGDAGVPHGPEEAVVAAVTPTGGAKTPLTARQAIQAALNGIADDALQPYSVTETAPYLRTRTLVALLADCYSRQVYGSATVASMAALSPDFPWRWWEALPDPQLIQQFRAKNLKAIQTCLVAALQFRVDQKVSAGALAQIDAPQLAKEASRRIVMAAFADSMELQKV